ncbi:hypothetical protein GWI33_004965 [Rhynchophorus ferrugineus]|uniref:Uncharacterized protein n=1 Tax=Rhynchophorus ferrugineus TaxID=354439 RepID=A0A834ME85_RHYFE|nr:hypothetical protein GWI33_004965 [Rhynchophorus ferrugineus]
MFDRRKVSSKFRESLVRKNRRKNGGGGGKGRQPDRAVTEKWHEFMQYKYVAGNSPSASEIFDEMAVTGGRPVRYGRLVSFVISQGDNAKTSFMSMS